MALRGIVNRFMGGRGAAGGVGGRRTTGGVGGGMGTGRAGAGRGGRAQDEAIGRGVKKLFRRVR